MTAGLVLSMVVGGTDTFCDPMDYGWPVKVSPDELDCLVYSKMTGNCWVSFVFKDPTLYLIIIWNRLTYSSRWFTHLLPSCTSIFLLPFLFLSFSAFPGSPHLDQSLPIYLPRRQFQISGSVVQQAMRLQCGDHFELLSVVIIVVLISIAV